MAKVKLSNRKGWVRLKKVNIHNLSHGEEVVANYNNQYVVGIVSKSSIGTITMRVKYKNDFTIFLTGSRVTVFKIIDT